MKNSRLISMLLMGSINMGTLILFYEGRNVTKGVKGMTLEEATNVLLEIVCIKALNLDGGGSSCMLINGKETIKPSDGKQRSVVTAVAFY